MLSLGSKYKCSFDVHFISMSIWKKIWNLFFHQFFEQEINCRYYLFWVASFNHCIIYIFIFQPSVYEWYCITNCELFLMHCVLLIRFSSCCVIYRIGCNFNNYKNVIIMISWYSKKYRETRVWLNSLDNGLVYFKLEMFKITRYLLENWVFDFFFRIRILLGTQFISTF